MIPIISTLLLVLIPFLGFNKRYPRLHVHVMLAAAALYLILAVVLFSKYGVMFGVWGAIYGVAAMLSSAMTSD